MFPTSLHKNIRELDKQISLLEAECDNIESDNRTKSTGRKMFFPRTKGPTDYTKSYIGKNEIERAFVTGPRGPVSNSVNKITKVLMEAKGCSKSSKDIPRKPLTGRTSSHTTVDEPSKSKTNYRNCQLCGKSREKSQSVNKTNKKNQNGTQCKCGKELLGDSVQNMDVCETESKQNESSNENYILHKGILHANPGGTIEVTVTQKSSKSVNNADIGVPCGRVVQLNKDVCPEKNSNDKYMVNENQSCNRLPSKSTPRHKKWSEILSQDSDSIKGNKNKVKKLNNGNNNYTLCSSLLGQIMSASRKQAADGDVNIGLQNLGLDKFEEHLIAELQNEDSKRSESPFLQKKSKSPFVKKNIIENVIDISPQRPRQFEDREVQCTLGNEGHGKLDVNDKSEDPSRVLYYLIDILQGRNGDERYEQLLDDLKKSLKNEVVDEKKKSSGNKPHGDIELPVRIDNDYIENLRQELWSAKKLCEKLTEEKNQLTEELGAKQRLIVNFNAKEKEYLSKITNLKVNLEKKRVQADENIDILKELDDIKDKLANETKVSDALRKSHKKMQEQIHKSILENERLKTQLRLTKLESEKFCVLLAGKDAEIKKYREEIESFQRQISDQLAILRSNNAGNEVQKAVEAIIHHSRLFSQTDLDSTLTDSQTEDNAVASSSKRDRLMHSSPTSTKSSGLDSSWNHISSIHECDSSSNRQCDNGNNTPDLKMILRNDPNPMEIEIPIGKADENNGYEAGSSKQSRETDNRKDLSFVSCKSAEDSGNELTTRTNGTAEMTGHELEDHRRSGAKGRDSSPSLTSASRRIRRNIEDLFQEIREKCAQGIFTFPNDQFRFDDLFINSDTSDFSEVSGSCLGND